MITNKLAGRMHIIRSITSSLIVDIVSNCSRKAPKYALSNNLTITFRSDKLLKICDV